MNQNIFEGDWEITKAKLKQAWAELTDDDLLQIEGNQQEIFGRLMKYYGYTADEVKEIVREFKNKNDL